ncbi:hypothetical protein F5884DRAFT_747060 [Xylogone sp. PMI_703]|nr:hypothetical protein F5884DRAFT_747060 [Xylogone sp. PMI_703]
MATTIVPLVAAARTTCAPTRPSASSKSQIPTAVGIGVGVGIGIVLVVILVVAALQRVCKRTGASQGLAVEDQLARPPQTPQAPQPRPSRPSRLRQPLDMSNPVPVRSIAPHSLELYLPQGRDEDELVLDHRCLGTLFEIQAGRYYHLDTVAPDSSDVLLACLEQLGLDKDFCNRILSLTLDPTTRVIAIRGLLARVIFSNLSTYSTGPLSLLPPVVTVFKQSLPKSYFLRDMPPDLRPLDAAAILWRRLTAYLMQEDPFIRMHLEPPSSIKPQMEVLLTKLDQFLAPFAKASPDSSIPITRIEHLEGTIDECTKFGYELFSIESEYRFSFKTPPGQEDGVVVLPGLEKVCMRNGLTFFDHPWEASPPEIVHIDRAKT